MKLITSNARLFVLIILNLIPFQNRDLPRIVVERNHCSELVVCVRSYACYDTVFFWRDTSEDYPFFLNILKLHIH